MLLNVDKYLGKTFSYRKYNCYHFVRDAWLELTGVDLGNQVPDQPSVETYTEKAFLVANTLVPLSTPEEPSIVLFQRASIEPHIGVYYRGRVLHLTKSGAYYMPLNQVAAGYTTINYYK